LFLLSTLFLNSIKYILTDDLPQAHQVICVHCFSQIQRYSILRLICWDWIYRLNIVFTKNLAQQQSCMALWLWMNQCLDWSATNFYSNQIQVEWWWEFFYTHEVFIYFWSWSYLSDYVFWLNSFIF
jgi:hypothetical protein